MPGNPLVDQGFLNRLRASVVWNSFTNLNVTSSYLDREGINLRLTGDMSMQHQTMTGVVQSPEPYVMCEIVVALLRTQPLSDAYKTQQETNVVLGQCTLFPDVPTEEGGLSPFQFQNMAIQGVGELLMNGTTPIYGVTLRGFYIVNNNLWN